MSGGAARSADLRLPRYLERFRCVGGDCPETCCGGWSVAIDRATYQRYVQIRKEPLASLMRQYLRHDPSGSSARQATMALREDLSCPMLDEQQLCRIQREQGAAALSQTCRQYPRLMGQDGLTMQQHASLSCPEAARLALSDADAMDWVQTRMPAAEALAVPLYRRRPPVAPAETDLVRAHAPLIGDVAMALQRLPGLSASQGLVLTGMLLRRIAAIEEVGEAGALALAAVLEQALSPQRLDAAPQLLSQMPIPRQAQLSLLWEATARYLGRHGGRPSFRKLALDVSQGLALSEGLEQGAQRLEQIALPRLLALEAAQPHLLKNLLLNELGKSLFPHGDRAGLEREFMGLAVRYAMVRLYALGLAALRGDAFGPEDLVRATYVVARNIEHHREFLPALFADLEAADAMRLEVLATLVL